MYRRALVPLDGSPLAEGVLPLLLKIARPLDMSIRLLRVLEPPSTAIGDGMRPSLLADPESRVREAEDYLAASAASLRALGTDVTVEVRHGRPDEQIVEAARETGADLIAMSTHGRSGLGRLLFGSVAEQVLRNADVPVFLMRQTESRMMARR
jgi:nucleotide-binding universal stress UspA family protein